MANQRRQPNREPWNNQTYKRENRATVEKLERRQVTNDRRKKNKGTRSTVFLTVLVVIMFAIIAFAIFFTIWNNRHPNMNTVADHFYPKSEKVTAAKASSASSSAATSSSSSVAMTYTISSADSTMTALEKNTGLSWDELCKLNTNLDPNNQGKNKDGSWIYVGEVLKIK